jgi:CheY-like chemotaxis protein
VNTKVLIADDDGELSRIYGMLLTERGYDVETATDGLDCIRKLRCRHPAVLVLDLEMRWGGGDGVLAWLREEGLSRSVAVVLTATSGAPEMFAEHLEPPVVQRLWKPFTLTALLESVRTAAPSAASPLLVAAGKEAS